MAGRVPCGEVGWVVDAILGRVEAVPEAGRDGDVVDAAGRVGDVTGLAAVSLGRGSVGATFSTGVSMVLGAVACWSARRFTLGLSVMGPAKSNSPGATSGSGLAEGRLFSDMSH